MSRGCVAIGLRVSPALSSACHPVGAHKPNLRRAERVQQTCDPRLGVLLREREDASVDGFVADILLGVLAGAAFHAYVGAAEDAGAAAGDARGAVVDS
jgi:hypothetical protein